jgi:hypothetical protein
MTKFVETFFRHKLLLLLPPLLISAVVTGYTLVSGPVYYESLTGVWVDRPAYLASSNTDWNTYVAPSVNQSTRLNELLRTQNFVNDVARRTVLAPLLSSPKGQDRISQLIAGGLTMTASGHLLVLRMKSENAQLSYQVLSAVVGAFKDSVASDRINQASLATSFYESRLATATDELAQAGTDARQYMAANPRLGAVNLDLSQPLPSSLQTLGVDPQLLDIQRRIESKQAEVDGLRKSLDQARLDASASLEGQELGFQVIDAPQIPTTGGRDLRKRIILPAGAMIGSLALSGVMLVLMAMNDRSVRSLADVAGMGRVVGELPDLRLKRIQRRIGAASTRRAVGFEAGAVLPALRGAK